MAIFDHLGNVVGSWQMNSGNYSGGAVQDAGPLARHLEVVGATPDWQTYDSIAAMNMMPSEGSYFEIPNHYYRLSAILALHLDEPGSIFPVYFGGYGYGSDDHAKETPTGAWGDRDNRAIWATSVTSVRSTTFAGGGHTATGVGSSNAWQIVTVAFNHDSLKIKLQVNDGTPVESTAISKYSMQWAEEVCRIGWMAGTYGSGKHCAIGELHFLNDHDVLSSQSSGLAAFVAELKTKYGIT